VSQTPDGDIWPTYIPPPTSHLLTNTPPPAASLPPPPLGEAEKSFGPMAHGP